MTTIFDECATVEWNLDYVDPRTNKEAYDEWVPTIEIKRDNDGTIRAFYYEDNRVVPIELSSLVQVGKLFASAALVMMRAQNKAHKEKWAKVHQRSSSTPPDFEGPGPYPTTKVDQACRDAQAWMARRLLFELIGAEEEAPRSTREKAPSS